jgi:hypothetical protein
MSIINEEIDVAEGQGSVMVLERTHGECVRPWAILLPQLGDIDRMTPRELRAFGRELIAIGKKVGREYTSSGKARTKTQGDPQ